MQVAPLLLAGAARRLLHQIRFAVAVPAVVNLTMQTALILDAHIMGVRGRNIPTLRWETLWPT